MKRRHHKMMFKQNDRRSYQKTLDLSPNKNFKSFKNVSFAQMEDKENFSPPKNLGNGDDQPRDFQDMINQVSPIQSKALKSRMQYKAVFSEKSPCDESKRDMMVDEPFTTPRNDFRKIQKTEQSEKESSLTPMAPIQMMPNPNDGTYYINNITNNIIYDSKEDNQNQT